MMTLVVLVLQVLHPVCHVRNLMLWTAVYLPSSSPTTPSDDSCAPYPVPGGNPEDTPLSRLVWGVAAFYWCPATPLHIKEKL